MKNKILLVEDNPRYANSAEQYLTSKNCAITLARDYSEAMRNLKSPEFEGVISDCFFPEITSTGRVSLGEGLVDKMEEADPRLKENEEGAIEYGKRWLRVDVNDTDVKKYLRFRRSIPWQRQPIPSEKLMEKVSFGKDQQEKTQIFKGIYEPIYTKDSLYGMLRNAIRQSETNQPLGLLVAERCEALSLPFVLNTSTYHHDCLTEPVVAYAGRNGWRIVDCTPKSEQDKANPEFWERAFGELERKLKLDGGENE